MCSTSEKALERDNPLYESQVQLTVVVIIIQLATIKL